MATVVGKLACPAGKYQKDGEEKTRWTFHGIVLQTDNGLRVKLESLPLVEHPEGIWFSVFEDDNSSSQKPRQQKQQGFRDSGRSGQAGTQDDIPF